MMDLLILILVHSNVLFKLTKIMFPKSHYIYKWIRCIFFKKKVYIHFSMDIFFNKYLSKKLDILKSIRIVLKKIEDRYIIKNINSRLFKNKSVQYLGKF